MSRTTAIIVLFLAAVLEAGGDAIVRQGIHASGTTKALLMLAGAVVLFAYGYAVNAPAWDFGKLLGIYVVFFFVVAQIISYFAFRQVPSVGILIGGALIISGGAVIAVSSR